MGALKRLWRRLGYIWAIYTTKPGFAEEASDGRVWVVDLVKAALPVTVSTSQAKRLIQSGDFSVCFPGVRHWGGWATITDWQSRIALADKEWWIWVKMGDNIVTRVEITNR